MLDNFGEYNFCEAALSGYYSRTIVDKKQNTIKSPSSILAELRAKGLGTNKLDNCFKGLHRFRQDLIAHVDSGNPINAYYGKYLSDFIVLDIDHSGGAHLAVPLLKELLESLDIQGLKVTEPERFSYATTGLKGFVFLIHAGAIGFEPEVNFADITRKFCELLLPGKVGKGQGFLVDASNFESARLYRVIGSFNAPKNPDEAEKTKDRIRGYKVELIWNDILELIKKPEHVYELWQAPNARGLDDQTILGARYWKCEPVPLLQGLWQQAKETWKEVKVQVQGASFTPSKISTRHPVCVANLLSVIQNGDPDNILAGHRHQAFLGLSTYAANALGLSVSPQAHAAFVTEIHNRLPAVKQLPEHELREIIRDGLKFSFSCGNADSGTSLMKFCGGSCIKKPNTNPRMQSPLELLPGVSDYFQQVISPFKIGLRKIDDFMGGLDRKSINIFLGDPNVGKSLIGLQSLLKAVKIAKELNFCTAFISPEEDLVSLASNVAMQLERKPKGMIYREFADQGIPNFREWCEEYSDYVRFIDANVLTAKGIQQQLEEVRQTTGKPLPMFYLDNITLVRLAASNLANGVNMAQKVADELKELVFNMGAAMIATLHLPKASGNRQVKKGKDGRSYSHSVPDLMSGFGTNFWAILSSSQFGLSKRDRFLTVNWTKCRKRQHGDELLPKPFYLFVTKYYRALEYEEVLALSEEEKRKLGVDMMEFEALENGIDPLADDEPPKKKSKGRSVLEFAE